MKDVVRDLIKKYIMRIMIILISISFMVSCGNIFKDFSNLTTDDAILTDIQKLRTTDIAAALAKFDELSAAKLATREMQYLKAGILSEGCGLDFLSFSTALGTSGPGNLLFKVAMTEMAGATEAKVAYCIAADTIMDTLNTAADLDQDENIFNIFLMLAKMGSIINLYADLDDDGEVDVAFDENAACSNVIFPNDASDYHVGHIATGVTKFKLSLSNLTGTVGDFASIVGDAINTLCDTVLTGPLVGYNFCSSTDASALTPDQVIGIRSMVGEKDALGIGSCTAGDLSNPVGGGGCFLCP